MPYAIAALIVVAVTLWPGDTPWGGDDVVLLTAAARCDAVRKLTGCGLTGSFGYPYGPLPVEVYQVLLEFSHDLATVVQLHAAIFTASTLFGLFWLVRRLSMSPWLVLLPVVGPFFWFYSRLLWDNPMAIPAGTLMLAAYLEWWTVRRAWAFWIVAAAGPFLLLTHPMTIPLVAAVAIHAIVTRHTAVLRSWIPLVVMTAVAIYLSLPYFQMLDRVLHKPPARTGVESSSDGYAKPSRPAAAAYPLMSGRLMTAYGFFDKRGFEPGLESSTIGRMAAGFSRIAIPVVLVGFIVSAIRFPRGWRSTARPIETASAVAVLALVLQSGLDALMRLPPWPHYFNGTWPVIALMLWTGLTAIRPRPLAVGLAIMLGLCTAGWTSAFVIDIHRNHGGPVWYGPTITSQGVSSTDSLLN
jgi:hypothetical protein